MQILKEWFNLVLSVLSPKTLLHPWKYPKSPWPWLPIDYASPLFGTMYLIVVDAFSKWVKVAITHTASSEATIEGLHEVGHTWGPRYYSLRQCFLFHQ